MSEAVDQFLAGRVDLGLDGGILVPPLCLLLCSLD